MKKSELKKVMMYSGMIGWILTVVACGKVSSSKMETTGEKENYSPRTEIFLVAEPDKNRNEKKDTIVVGTIKVNGAEENWVLAKKELEAAKFLIMMYANNLDYMKACSKSLDKNKVDRALSKWRSKGDGAVFFDMDREKSGGGEYALFADNPGKGITFFGGDGRANLQGSGIMRIKMVQEIAIFKINNKYTVTDIEFN
jgi:hypothetical protein